MKWYEKVVWAGMLVGLLLWGRWLVSGPDTRVIEFKVVAKDQSVDKLGRIHKYVSSDTETYRVTPGVYHNTEIGQQLRLEYPIHKVGETALVGVCFVVLLLAFFVRLTW